MTLSSHHSTLNSAARPSSLYSSGFWKLGLRAVRLLPRSICELLIGLLVQAYWISAPERRNVVIQNLKGPLDNDIEAATRKARALYRQFGLKLLDLWQYESGQPVDTLLGKSTGWVHFEQARAEKKGVLVLTPHLGNWEFGGPWLTREGVDLQVVSQAEPGQGLTELRQAGRARWKVQTLVIGNDPFAFLEIIRRLEAGATVALLVDRPPPQTATTVELFGKTFAASSAPAELARASGCVLLPVYIPRTSSQYEAHVLPPVPYDRSSLREPRMRQQLTQEIMRQFEPAIRQYADQWYHFVPVWPQRTQ